MFGLEKGKKEKAKKSVEETFDLELEMLDNAKCKALKAKVDERVQTLKDLLRKGDDQENFEQLGILLHGYSALQKVITNVTKKK